MDGARDRFPVAEPSRGRPAASGAPRSGTAVEAEALEEALQAALKGDELAFRAVYRDVHPRLLRYLRALVGADADDVASDAWLQIARDLGAFRGDYDRFRGWTTRIARNRAIDHLRKAGRRPGVSLPVEDLPEPVSAQDTESAALERLSTEEAVALIARLPQDQAEAVLLRVVIGLDAKEAGRVLGKRAGSVRTAAYRGLRRLAENLERKGGGERSDARTRKV
ncbi:RNA polymerase sigma factor [Thermomonospora amylolytica]|uniref:RNA polymerase sigma factor n=1 Tax=Thermomonospora amylolytica TaxID=1411117 RepID=UPI000E6CC156|nr:RNA polymerase sigma factor [Thermomonospora amylolytica]